MSSSRLSSPVLLPVPPTPTPAQNVPPPPPRPLPPHLPPPLLLTHVPEVVLTHALHHLPLLAAPDVLVIPRLPPPQLLLLFDIISLALTITLTRTLHHLHKPLAKVCVVGLVLPTQPLVPYALGPPLPPSLTQPSPHDTVPRVTGQATLVFWALQADIPLAPTLSLLVQLPALQLEEILYLATPIQVLMYHKKELQSDENLETESIEEVGQKVWSVSVSEMLGMEGRIQALFVDVLHATVIIFLVTSSISLQIFLKDLVSKYLFYSCIKSYWRN
ncbi:hypothetical protein E2C01_057907 [Portunus trituberculatus]|uniref:Uncharacterized protein n=1 Tax=Portunus trituberculatus TaxID=210409 RepID=A0A5B7GU74_PORTR|nr:hypothetical protein [Portunus trituberculatus]